MVKVDDRIKQNILCKVNFFATFTRHLLLLENIVTAAHLRIIKTSTI